MNTVMNAKRLISLGMAIALGAMFALSGCSFNQPTEASKKVTLVKAYNVKGCQKLGRTVARVKSTLAGMPISQETIREELITIAKNDAGDMGGDSIVAVTPIQDGVQTFDIYRCAQ